MPKAVPLPPPNRAALALTLTLTLAACQAERSSPPSSRRPAPGPSASASGGPRLPQREPEPRQTVEVPGGILIAGSTPGAPGRIPELEPKRPSIELGPFRIDRLPYPNDPAEPALLGKSRDEARRLCAERSARLCTEVEWERACKGPKQDDYPSGVIWDPSCAVGPKSCATGFDVLGLGTTAPEWVASDVVIDDKRRALTRGAGASASSLEHRCAARHPIDAGAEPADVGFRCCSGAPNAASIDTPKQGPLFSRAKLTADELEQALAADPATKALARDIKFFREPEGASTVVSRGPGDKKGFDFTVAPLLWSPTAGAEILLVTARSGETTSFVVAFHVLPDGKYRLASSFTLQNEPGPVALAYSADIKPRVHFSTCWGCPGETGKALFRKPETVVIVQP